MRLDKFLQVSRLVKRRTIANTLCSRGAISVNGHVAKAGRMLAVGDVIRLPHPSGVEEVPEPAESVRKGNPRNLQVAEIPHSPKYEVLELPSGNVSRARAATLYRQLNS
jgi:ribosomal 50S subunit-recycling heat shock protein